MEIHSDDLAVDRFATAMKEKLARKRAQGRGGWEDKQDVQGRYLSQLLREHVAKGDPVDVANFAMMLHQRGERIDAFGAFFPDITAIQYLWIEKQRRDRRQQAMLQWARDTFGGIENFDPCSIEERARRFLEEAIELCQAVGVTRQETDTVADYVFGREPGRPAQEIGGAMVTLNCLAEVLDESVCKAELDEWQRVQSKSKAHFEARHRAKMEVGL